MWTDIIYSPGWQDPLFWTVIVGFLLAFILAFGMGANDCANSYGCVVGAGVLKLWQAYLIATFMETSGAALLGYRVTNTMRKSIVDVEIYNEYTMVNKTENATLYTSISKDVCNSIMNNKSAFTNHTSCYIQTSSEFIIGELAALAATAFWLIMATVFRMPVSTTQSAVGATVGFSLVMRGADGINWWMMARIVGSWLASPLLAGFFATTFYLVIKFTVLRRTDSFEAALKAVPFWFWFAILVNMFAVFFDGTKYLKFNYIPWWGALILSCSLGFLVACGLWFKGVSLIRARANKLYDEETQEAMERGAATPGVEQNGTDPDIYVTETRTRTQTILQSPINLFAKYIAKKMGITKSNRDFQTIASECRRKELELDENSPPKEMAPKRTLSYPLHRRSVESDSATPRGTATPRTGSETPRSRDSPIASPPQISGYSTADLVTPRAGVDPKIVAAAVDPKSLKDRLKSLAVPAEEDPKTVKVFHFLQILSACFLSFSHGSNDTANSVGPLVGLWLTYKDGLASVDASNDPSMEYIIIYGALSMIVGLWFLGHKVIKTIGSDITNVTSPSGFSMELGTAFTVILGSKLNIPLSTTHCMVGAVVIVGIAKEPFKKGVVSWKLFKNIVITWIVTIPVTCGVSALLTYVIAHFYLGTV